LEYAQHLGAHSLTLNVWCGNESAMRFYEKMGMKPRNIMMETKL
jgi:RimJ/RimL family protein N-acetyltransferase